MSYKEDYPGSSGYPRTGGTGSTGTGSSYGTGGSSYGSSGYGSGTSTYGGNPTGYGTEGSEWMTGRSNFSNPWVWSMLLLGAAAGAAAALLFTPSSGREMRDNLRSWARDTKDKATRVAQDVQQRARQAGSQFSSGTAGTTTGGRGESDLPQL